MTFEGEDLLALSPEDRAAAGVFLAFQYPVEIPGVGNLYFLRTALNSVRRRRGLDQLDVMDFLALAEERMKLVEMDRSFMSRSVNEGFSGGEKKRNEILQMAILEPTLAILDETDSGLDIDALRVVAGGVNALRSPDRAMLVITHHQRLLDYIVPDRVHVMAGGRIVRSGGKDLALDLEAHGYGDAAQEAPSASDGATVTIVDVRAAELLRPRPPRSPDCCPDSGCPAGGAGPAWLTQARRAAADVGHPAGIPDAQGRGLEIHASGAAARRAVRACPRRRRSPGLAGRDRPIEHRRIDRPHGVRQRVLRPSLVVVDRPARQG